MVRSHSKGQFQGREGKTWAFEIYLHWYLRNGACYDQSLYETHMVSHIWSFSLPHDIWPWMTFKGQIKVIECLMGYISWIVHVMTKVYMKHILWSFSWLHDIWPWIIFKGQIKVIQFWMGRFSWIGLLMTKVYMKHR